MDNIINKINDDIREIQINPCYEVSLIGRSIYLHFRSIVRLYEDESISKNRIIELGVQIKLMRKYLNKENK